MSMFENGTFEEQAYDINLATASAITETPPSTSVTKTSLLRVLKIDLRRVPVLNVDSDN